MSASGFDRQSLFDSFDPAPIDGLSYRSGYISTSEEVALMHHIDRQPWSLELQRRRQWYGMAYNDVQDGVIETKPAEPLPPWLGPLAQRLHDDGHFDGVPDRSLVNEYQPGQGIGAHRDRDTERIRTVAIVSLGSAITLEFSRLGQQTRDYYLQPRSLVVMRGEARHTWLHGISPRLSDKVGGLIVPRGRRLSVTFRHVRTPEMKSL